MPTFSSRITNRSTISSSSSSNSDANRKKSFCTVLVLVRSGLVLGGWLSFVVLFRYHTTISVRQQQQQQKQQQQYGSDGDHNRHDPSFMGRDVDSTISVSRLRKNVTTTTTAAAATTTTITSSGIRSKGDAISNKSRSQNENDNSKHRTRNIIETSTSTTTSKTPSTTSACILILDENHRLPEWLAYHYYTMNLRYVVVAVDPHSKTSPTQIFDRWRKRSKMTIIEWSDQDFAEGNYMKNASVSSTNNRRTTMTLREQEQTHRHRQRDFYRACIRHLMNDNNLNTRTTATITAAQTASSSHTLQRQQQQQQQRHQQRQYQQQHWVLFQDVDEYISINRRYWKDDDAVVTALVQQPGGLLQVIETLSTTSNTQQQQQQRQQALLPFDHAVEPTTARSWYEHFQKSACVSLGRVLYSAKEVASNHDLDARHDTLPTWIDPKRYNTLRFRYRASLDSPYNGRSKSMIDVSRLLAEKHLKGWTNPHQPLTSVCKDEYTKFQDLPIGIHHYLGDWDSYGYRDDARQTKSHGYDTWKERSMLDGDGIPNDDGISRWIHGFIHMIGEEAALYLLQESGILAVVK